MKILIVSLRAGNGHVKAAQAIEIALKNKYPADEISNVDLLDHVSILSKEFYGDWYMDLVNAVPQFYAFMYEKLNAKSTSVRLLSDRINAKKFKKLVFDFNPDLIYATHFVPGNLVSFWREKYKKSYKIITTLTDYEAHPLWVDNKFDLYTVATEDVKKEMIDLGADKNKIVVTGIPIDLKFSKALARKSLLQKMKLADNFTIALFAGAFGRGPIIEIFQKIIALRKDFQILIVAGKNEELKKDLEKISKKTEKTVRILGFVDNMEEIMAMSDIAISKAGGLTVSESLAINLPLIINSPYPGQEEANTRFLQYNLAAFSTDDTDEIPVVLENIIAKPYILEEMRKNIKKIAKPLAALEIADLGHNLISKRKR